MTDIQNWFASLETPMRIVVMLGAAMVIVLTGLALSVAYLALLDRSINKRFETFIALSSEDRRWIRLKAKEFARIYIGSGRNDTLSQIIFLSFGIAPAIVLVGISIFLFPEIASQVSNTTPIDPPPQLTSLLLGLGVSLLAYCVILGLPWPKSFREHLFRGAYVKDWKKLETANKHELLRAIGRGDIKPQQVLNLDALSAYSRRGLRQFMIKFILILFGVLVLVTGANTLFQTL
ncbi:hypothetical protein [Oceanicaulis sp. MMSF_3324]|uniref:hypothetical protein n=1 Tax=Oceanicaulis sp. MMSF_3324 TaxID=3046702 RepID=UPI00273DDE68|nr:hypothetical protein [Oceanicaulis sp. MMSF_3324]